MRRRYQTTGLITMLLALSCFFELVTILAAPGDLDTTFAGTGKIRTGFGLGEDDGNAVAVQADGKIVVAGSSSNGLNESSLAYYFSVVRYNIDGSLDISFDGDGKVMTAIGAVHDIGKALAIQSDGKIVVAGYSSNASDNIDFAVARYNTNGSLDDGGPSDTTPGDSFGNGGIVTTAIGTSFDAGNAMAIQSDGKIVVAGQTYNGSKDDFAAVRYNADGSLDTSFNGTGIVTTSIGTSGDAGNAVGIQPNGKLVVAGASFNGSNHDFAVVRYNADGSLDSTFDGDGKLTTAIGSGSDVANALTFQFSSIQPLKIVVAGFASTGGGGGLAVARYNEDGSLDTSFNGVGVVLLLSSTGTQNARAVKVQRTFTGQVVRILIAGYRNTGSSLDFAVGRLFLDGSLDAAFGGDGVVETDFGTGGDFGNAMVLQSDKIIVAGTSEAALSDEDFAVVRYNLTDGSLDTSFNATGKRTDDIGNGQASANSVALQTDGKIVVAGAVIGGSGANNFAVARYNADGSLDSTFDGDGKVVTWVTTFGGAITDFEGKAVSMQADGKIVVAGSIFLSPDYDFALLRYNADGSVDDSFDQDGLVVTNISDDDSANAIAIQADGKIVVAGSSWTGLNWDFAVVRYNTDGSVDDSFSGGEVVIPVGAGDDFGNAVAIQADGKIVVAGRSGLDIAVVRFNSDGLPDNTFDGDGTVTTSIGTGRDHGAAVAIQADGKIVVAGYSDADSTGDNDDFAVMRYNADGSLDGSFDSDGIVTTPVGATVDQGAAVAIQADGKLVVAGSSANGSYFDFAVARYNPDGSLDSTYGNLGKVVVDLSQTGHDAGFGLALDSTGKAVVAGPSADYFGVVRLLGGDGPVWTGATSSDWSTPANWLSNNAPTTSDSALLPASGVTHEAVLNADVSIHSIVIEAGRSLTINPGRTLTVNGNFVLNGTLSGGGTILFNGTNFVNNNSITNVNVHFGAGLKQLSGTGFFLNNTVTVLPGSTLQLASGHLMERLIVNSAGALDIPSGKTLSLFGSGLILTNNGSVTGAGTISFDGTVAQSTSGAVAFGGLTINNPAGVSLGADATVNDALNLTSGDLNTGAFTLTMPATATSTGTTDVVGNIKRTGFTTANTLSFGNPFNTVRFTSGTPPTDVTVNLVKQAPTDFTNAVRRTFTITPTGGSGFAATLRLRYLDSELNGNAEATLGLWRKSTSWTNLGATTRNATDNWVELAGIGQFSPWTIAGPSGPTAVEFMSATVTQFPDGTFIEWQTGFEVSNLGFRLHKDENGKRTLINPELVAGSALIAGSVTLLTSGKSYTFWDEKSLESSESVQSQPVSYWLEDLDLSGESTWHGPFFANKVVGRRQKALGTSINLAEVGAQTASNGATFVVEPKAELVLNRSAQRPLAVQSASLDLASSHAVRISVKQAGWYRLAQTDLLAAGLPKTARPELLQLFVDGEQVPISVTGDEDGNFDAADAVEFYGLGLDTPSTDTRVYWLIEGAKHGLRIEKAPAVKGFSSAESFTHSVERRDRSVYFAALLNGDQENFFGAIVTNTEVEQQLFLEHVQLASPLAASLQLSLQGVTGLAHQVNVRLNDHLLGSLNFIGQAKGQGKFDVPHDWLREAENTVTLQTSDGAADIVLVDFIRLTYQHTYEAEHNRLTLTAQGGEQVTLSGFSAKTVRVFDVTDECSVQELSIDVAEEKTGYVATFTTAGQGDRQLLAFCEDNALPAASLEANHASTWRRAGNRADLVIITHADLIPALQPLVELRTKQGFRVAVVDIADLYDEFSFGHKAPQAIKDFLMFAVNNWRQPPQFVLFAGDASYDARNYLGFGEADLVPTRLLDTSFMQTASDDWFADFNNDGLAELSVGRLPVRTASETAAIVRKLISYDEALPSKEVLLVADRNDGFNFELASTTLRSLIPKDYPVREIFRSQHDDPSAKHLLLTAINHGATVVNYTGHGSVNSWRGNLLATADAPAFINADRLSLFVMMTCLNGYFQDAAGDSLAEALVKAENGGAVAVWASSGLTMPEGQARMNEEFLRLLFSSNRQVLTVGEMIRRAKAAVPDSDIRSSWILLGDPSMRFK